jgi:hypothetical protein
MNSFEIEDARKERNLAAAKAAMETQLQMKRDLAALAQDEAGLRILRAVFRQSEFGRSSVSYAKDGRVDLETTMFVEAFKGLYQWLRAHMTDETRMAVERQTGGGDYERADNGTGDGTAGQ